MNKMEKYVTKGYRNLNEEIEQRPLNYFYSDIGKVIAKNFYSEYKNNESLRGMHLKIEEEGTGRRFFKSIEHKLYDLICNKAKYNELRKCDKLDESLNIIISSIGMLDLSASLLCATGKTMLKIGLDKFCKDINKYD